MMSYLIALTLLVAPIYSVRFSIAGLPTNLLMVWLFALWLIFFVHTTWHKQWLDFFRFLRNGLPKPFVLLFIAWFIVGLLSLAIGGLTQNNIGQWLVLFFQPMVTAAIAGYVFHSQPNSKQIVIKAIYLFLAITGIYALIQYLTLLGVPVEWWGNSNEPKRALTFFTHPNGYALFITPLLAFLIPDVVVRFKGWKNQWPYILAWLVGGLGLLLSLSRGGWLGLAVAGIVFVIVNANRRYLAGAAIALVLAGLIISANDTLRYRFLLPFHGEKSAVARFSLWDTGKKMIEDSPIAGKGLTGFNRNWDAYNTDPNLEHYNSPHNIILNFWADTGLLGVATFLLMAGYGLWLGLRRNKAMPLAGLALFLIAILVHGLVDTPYLKNDLALMYWLVWTYRIS